MQAKLFILLFFLFGKTFSQTQFRSIMPADGSISNEVFDVFSDSKGYIWIGHNLGISRFDGFKFRHFNSPLQNGTSMSDICEDSQGRIWCHNFGSQIFYIENNKMQLLDNYDWKTEGIYPRMTIKNDTLYASSGRGAFIFDIKGKKSSYIKAEGHDQRFTQLVQNKDHTIYLAQGEPASLWSMKNSAITKIRFRFQYLVSLAFMKSDTLFTNEIGAKKIRSYLIKKDTLISLDSFDLDSKYNSCSQINGVYFVHAARTTYKYTNRKFIAEQDKENLNISKVTSNIEGEIYFSSLQHGVGVLLKQHMQEVKLGNIQTGIFFSTFERAGNNKILAGSNHGALVFIDVSSRKILQTTQTKITTHVADIHIDSLSQKIYAAGDGFYIFNYKLQTIQEILKTTAGKKIIQNDEGSLIYANSTALFIVPENTDDPRMKKWVKRYTHIILGNGVLGRQLNYKSGETSQVRCRSVAFDSKNGFILGAYTNGTFGYKPDTSFQLFADGKPVFATVLSYADTGTILAGSASDGLYIFKDNQFIRKYNTHSGLLSNTIRKIRYANGCAWLIFEQGIQRLNLATGNISSITSTGTEPLRNVQDALEVNGELWISANEKLYWMKLAAIKPQQEKVKLYNDYVTINDRDTTVTSGMVLSSNQNNIVFHLTPVAFLQKDNLILKYRLLGADDDWQLVNIKNTELRFASLKPGKYNLQAYVSDASGRQNSILIEFAFTIQKPWWQTWWVISLNALLVALVIFFIVKRRIRGINRQNLMLVEKLNLESQLRESMLTAIKSQMNPHFIFNALNTIQSHIYLNDKNMANAYLGKFSDLIRMILDNSNRRSITLAQEIRMLQLYLELEVMRFENTLTASLFVDPELIQDAVELPPMLVQPYVENAVKHGLLHKINNRVLDIRFDAAMNGSALKITITDNGVGRQKSQAINKFRYSRYQSFSSVANQQRIDLLNQSRENKITIEITDNYDSMENPAGTTVSIVIPL